MIKVRRATEADAPACARIVDAWIEATEWMARDIDYDGLVKVLTDGMVTREIFVAGDPVVGYLAFQPEKAHITGFYCARQGHGIGKALLDHLKEGRDYLRLNTHVPNVAAQRFYRREGFMPVTEMDGDRPEAPRELRMEWRA